MGFRLTFDGIRRELTAEERADPYETRWDGGKVVNLDDLAPDVFDSIAASETGVSWWGVYTFPAGTASRLYAVACAAAEHAGVEPPSKPANMREQKMLLDMLEETRNLEDEPFVNGFPPTPSETEVGSSSGPADDSDGSLPNPDENVSATS